MSLVKHNNNSISAVTSMANLSTGANVLIKEITASSDSSISFVDGSSDVVLDDTYPIYKFEFINIHPSSDGQQFQFNLSTDGGSNYNVSKTTTWFYAWHNEGDGDTNLTYGTGNDLANGTGYQKLFENLSFDNDHSGVGYLHLFNPSSTTFVKHFISRTSVVTNANYEEDNYIAGYGNTISSINAIDFKFSSGNIDSGTIKLYGIKDS